MEKLYKNHIKEAIKLYEKMDVDYGGFSEVFMNFNELAISLCPRCENHLMVGYVNGIRGFIDDKLKKCVWRYYVDGPAMCCGYIDEDLVYPLEKKFLDKLLKKGPYGILRDWRYGKNKVNEFRNK